ncbi:hypothetical protein HMN09_01202700 [Mycena chlorophos]|uniref:Rad60/SUMO-like domain-containing protein n=1 Tax=Mycena chlorophos TaxID=658473 RepID=A0A8H6S8I6_MYCCL|nr:hypothetical protein HMN09_01202700 [Mycena chlorophos]
MRFPIQLVLAALFVREIAAAPVLGSADARALAGVVDLVMERAPEPVADVLPRVAAENVPTIAKRSTLSLTITHGGHSIALKVKSTTSFSKILAAAQAKFGVRLLCTFDGARISPNDTPATLDMRSGDHISC